MCNAETVQGSDETSADRPKIFRLDFVSVTFGFDGIANGDDADAKLAACWKRYLIGGLMTIFKTQAVNRISTSATEACAIG